MKRVFVKQALASEEPLAHILVKGWVRTKREAKGFCFLEVNDGSCLCNLQIIVDKTCPGYDQVNDVGTGAAVCVQGNLVESPGKGQKWEVQATNLQLVGEADPETYPLQKKRHSDEFLRTIAQLRPRTNKYGALNRIRSEAALAIHDYFHGRGFYFVHTPIITGLDCEGAGELFQVTGLDLAQGPVNWTADFFGKKAYLTVSGQLCAEVLACALGQVYTFGPTFRAENSNTPRHAAEFWMIEPEVAFADLKDIMDLAEDIIKTVTRQVLAVCADDIGLFARFVDKDLEKNQALVLDEAFVRLPYVQAIEILQQAEVEFEYAPQYGADLQTEHERFLTEHKFKRAVIVYDYPKSIKPFYMRVNADGKTVAAMDVLLPRIGELVGGSQREERLEVLEGRMADLGLNKAEYEWYLDLRRFGTVPHSGFGLGFERLLMFLTGITNIRDVLPFPRTPKHLEF